ncbi:hypothetical protein ACHAXM_004562 [Skeletonema potamos]
MNDFKRRKFLKKIKIPPTLTSSDFIKGSTIVLLSRELKLVEYADTATRHLLVGKEERTTVLVTPSLFDSIGDVTSSIENEGYTLVDIKSLHFSSSIDDINEALQLLSGMELHDLCSSTSTPFVAMSFRGSDSIASVRKLVQSSPFRHGLVCPRVGEEKEFSNFFLHKDRSTATLEGCTCCVVRPHIIKDRTFGKVVSDILARGFKISAMQLFRLDKHAVAEFLQVYKGVLPQYVELVDEMCSGPLIALEVKRDSNSTEDVVENFRAHVGPWDYSVACELYPRSIRAKFGKSDAANAVHCTDLPKDGVIECEYFFKILAGSHRFYTE